MAITLTATPKLRSSNSDGRSFRAMKFLFPILVLFSVAARAETTVLGQGLPLPWPFPWAKECPVDWSRMAGRYILSESSDDEEIDLKISIISSAGYRIVHLSRYDRDGKLIADGFSFVTLNQRMLRMKLVPRDPYNNPMWALIKLHYSDWSLGCSEDHLVPILTLERENSAHNSTNHYRLVRIRH